MKSSKQTEVLVTNWNENTDVIPLIDLFVEMCFEDIHNVLRITQFKLVSAQMGYSKDMIDHVTGLGQNEYNKMLDEINVEGLGLEEF
jgi:hypothetical protein